MTAPTSVVTGVDLVSVPTRDLEVAMDFYGTALGLPRSSVYQRGTTAPDPDGNALMLHHRDAPRP
jgi:catechol-2,3-dioxygenase